MQPGAGGHRFQYILAEKVWVRKLVNPELHEETDPLSRVAKIRGGLPLGARVLPPDPIGDAGFIHAPHTFSRRLRRGEANDSVLAGSGRSQTP